ncbi:MAG: 3-deoxy-manno-octulosonate cytidylyltransferase [Pseudomonadota bacterium]
MKTLCVIPSRIASTRLPRKPLLNIQGKPMIQWVYENASRCKAIAKVVVATDNEEIATIIKNCGGEAIMTDPDLPTGTDRVAAVAADFPDMDVIINLQGDEPFIKPRMLEQLLSPYLGGELPDMTTLAYPLDMDKKYLDAGTVKVITDIHQNAIYFSRAPIPFFRFNHQAAPVYNHMGLYAFRRDFLLTYRYLKPTPLELIESLEQLRVIENGYKIRVCLTEEKTLEINTQEEYEQAQDFEYQL